MVGSSTGYWSLLLTLLFGTQLGVHYLASDRALSHNESMITILNLFYFLLMVLA